VNKVNKKSVTLSLKTTRKMFLKLSVQVVGLKNKDKSTKIKVQKNNQKIPHDVLIKYYKFLLVMH